MFEYNTGRSPLVLKEYGRNVQKLVEYLSTIEDQEKRLKYGETLIELMKQVTPTIRDNGEDKPQKMWDDLFIMSDFKLELDGPFPMPEKSILDKKPELVPYKTDEVKHRHYGRNVELLIREAIALEDEEDRKGAIVYIGRLMRTFYGSWNKDNVDEAVIVDHLKKMSDGKLIIDVAEVKEGNLFAPLYKDRRPTIAPSNSGENRHKGKRSSNYKSNKRRKN